MIRRAPDNCARHTGFLGLTYAGANREFRTWLRIHPMARANSCRRIRTAFRIPLIRETLRLFP